MLYLLCSVLGGHTLLGESNRALQAIRSPFLPTTSEEDADTGPPASYGRASLGPGQALRLHKKVWQQYEV